MDTDLMKLMRRLLALLVALFAVVLLVIAGISCSSSGTSGQEEEEPEQTLYESEDFSTMEWPASGVATNIPTPSWAVTEDDGTVKVTGELEEDSLSAFECKVAATEDDFSAYVKACKEAGYTLDYNSSSTSYEASSENGSELEIEFYADPWFYDISYFSLYVTAPDEEEQDESFADEEEAEEDEGEEGDAEADEADEEESSSDDSGEADDDSETDTGTAETSSKKTTYTIADDGDTAFKYTFKKAKDGSVTFKVKGTEDAVYFEIYSVEVDGKTYDVSDSSEFKFMVNGVYDGGNFDYVSKGDTRTWKFSCPAKKNFKKMKIWYNCTIFSLDSSDAVQNSWEFVEENLIIKKK